jgi:hypothetical protein
MSFQMKRPRSPSPQSESTSAKRTEISQIENRLKELQNEMIQAFQELNLAIERQPINPHETSYARAHIDDVERRYWSLYEEYNCANPNHEDLPDLFLRDLSVYRNQ